MTDKLTLKNSWFFINYSISIKLPFKDPKMRLADEKIRLLKSTILSILPSAKVYLFGSRVDDNKKGGDIDILIIADRTLNFIEEGQIERKFFKHYGAQKLDLVSFKETDKAPFKTVALMNAIQL